MVSFKDRLSGLRSKSTIKIGETSQGHQYQGSQRKATPTQAAAPTAKFGIIQMTLQKTPISHLDRFQFTLNDKASASAAKVSNNRSKSYSSINSNSAARHNPIMTSPKIDITSRHLQIERRRFSEASNKLDQNLLASSLFSQANTSSSNKKVKQLLDSLQFQQIIGLQNTPKGRYSL